MLRITPVESPNDSVMLRLEGRVSGPWVDELRAACEKALNLKKILALNLAEVSFLDVAGVNLLANLRARGVELVECSIFVREQLRTNNLRY